MTAYEDLPWPQRHIRIYGRLDHWCQVDGCPGREAPLYVEDILHPPRGQAIDFPPPRGRLERYLAGLSPAVRDLLDPRPAWRRPWRPGGR